MKSVIQTLIVVVSVVTQSFAFDWRTDVNSGDFTSESHPSDSNNVRKDGAKVGYIQNGNWIAFQNFDFGEGVGYLWIEGATPSGGTVEFRLGSHTGTLIGTVAIANTGDWNIYKPFATKITAPVTGVQNLCLKFVGGTGNLFNLAKFRFQRFAPDYKAPGAISARLKREPGVWTSAGSFTSESHPGNDPVRSENGQVTYISSNSWVGYANYDLGAGVNSISVEASSAYSGGTLEVRLGSSTGTVIGSLAIPGTGGWGNYQAVSANLTSTVSGVQNIFFKFVGSGGYIFNVARFRFQDLLPEAKSTGRWVAANLFDQESNPGGTPVVADSNGISELEGGSWVAYDNFNFGTGANLITVLAATPNKGGGIEVRTGSSSGPLIARLDVTHTGSWTLFREYTAALSQSISGVHNIYLKFVDTNSQSGSLCNLQSFIVEKQTAAPPPTSNEGTLYVYDAVTGLDPSPYYTYSVQKVSALNAPLKQNATNWESPFAWFSECKLPGTQYSTAYYNLDIGGWSHTYCNFELGKNTPIVVKITRTPNSFGAPSGPIFMANAHPAHKVQSCEVINGEVYVTMREPALVTVDIDGQMDTRDAPRSNPAEMDSSKPYRSREKGSHAVSIFANPVIEDKPVIGSPGVRYINPGDPLPAYNDSSWTTLYFGKGVHHFSRNPDGSPGIWKNGDAYILMSDKTCYIQGDAMIYGNFDGSAEGSQKHRVRIYGYGTVSAALMPHWDSPYWDEPAQAGTNYKDRGISMSSGYNCRFEGVTLADPANHGVAFDWGSGNLRRWMKQISWRANSDMGGIPGIVEDCFFRLQDDGPYVSGSDFRRNTLWFDCNGSPFRGTFIRRGTYGSGHQTVVEDCDIIYVRSNWGGAVISAGDYWEIGTYPDGAKNTAQHVIFRNIRVTDPRPTRTFFGLERGMAGMRFENVEYRHPHSWKWQSNFSGTATEPMHHCYFDGVFVEGKKMDEALLADPSLFQTSNISDFVFRDAPEDTPSKYNLLTSAADGSITLNPPGGSYDPGTVVTVTAVPDSGFLFDSWSGDLTGTTNPTTLVMDANKSITANMASYVLPRTGWVVSASSSNGSPANAIDGNIGTRWSTGSNQTNGQWFRIDMGSARTFNRIVLDAGSSAGDYPRGYQVYVSDDGVTWGSPVASGAGSSGVTTVTFASQTARYIRVTQTGSDSFYWWSIHEFNVYGPAFTLTETSPNGSVIFNPPGPTYFAGTIVTVTAVPDSNYAFTGWGGDLSGTTNPSTVTMTGNKSVTANFTPATYTLTTSAINGSILSDPPGGVYPPGTPVTLTPTPAPGYKFSSWSGDLSGDENPATLTMSGNKSVTANFWQPTQVTIDTTSGTTVLNYDAPGNTYIGNGTLQVSNNGSGAISLGTDGNTNPTVFAMTGGLITIDSGVTFVNGGWSKGIWTHNKADMQVNGTLDVSNGNPVIVNSLNGAGAIVLSDVSSSRATELHVGVLGGSGTFSGTIQEPHPGGSFVRIVKQGAGTQTFDNLANQKAGEIVINGGGVALLQDSDVTSAASIAGAGSLTKSGAGVLTLTGSITLTGPLTISEGTLSIGTNLSSTADVVIATGATLNLNFTEALTVNSLGVGGTGQLPPGIYGPNHSIYGSYFTGTGSLRIAGGAYETWAGTNGVSDGSPEGDADGDGIMNILEYVLGGDPRKSSAEVLPKAGIEGADLVLTYKRSDNSETDTIQAGQWSTNLQTWSNVDVAIELVSENGTAPDDMMIRIPLSKTNDGKLYGRLHVSKP